MHAKPSLPAIPLPRGWSSRVKSAILHVISLAQFTVAYTRGWAADSVNSRIRLKVELDRALQDNALLREEMRIKDARMARIPPHRRPLYPPTERMAILELKAARGWSLQQTAKTFLVTTPQSRRGWAASMNKARLLWSSCQCRSISSPTSCDTSCSG